MTPTQLGIWTGFGLKTWLQHNPKWTEAQWHQLVMENLDAIKGAAEPEEEE